MPTHLPVAALLLALSGGCVALSSENVCAPAEGAASAPLIYEDDDRMELFEHPSRTVRDALSASVVALVRPEVVRMGPTPRITARNAMDAHGICADEPYVDQPAAAFCSGVLVDKDLVLTAGHCVRDQADCDDMRFVFDFAYDGPGRLRELDERSVYRCHPDAGVVLREKVPGTDHDYAVIALDRLVDERYQAPPRRSWLDEPREGDRVFLAGMGMGVPMKIDQHAQVTDTGALYGVSFGVRADAFQGNSGSPIFDVDLNLVGILVNGRPDYVARCGCNGVRRAGEVSEAETVVYANYVLERVCLDTRFPAFICGEDTSCGDGFCSPTEDSSSCPTDC